MNKISLVIIGIVSLVLSRATFFLIDDPEGPNLLIVTVLAAIIFSACWGVYFLYNKFRGESAHT